MYEVEAVECQPWPAGIDIGHEAGKQGCSGIESEIGQQSGEHI